jgi:hypothetical protein
LSKALYDLKPSPRAWYDKIEKLLKMGFMRKDGKTLFVLKQGNDKLFVQIYVDDIIYDNLLL